MSMLTSVGVKAESDKCHEETKAGNVRVKAQDSEGQKEEGR